MVQDSNTGSMKKDSPNHTSPELPFRYHSSDDIHFIAIVKRDINEHDVSLPRWRTALRVGALHKLLPGVFRPAGPPGRLDSGGPRFRVPNHCIRSVRDRVHERDSGCSDRECFLDD